MEKYIANDIKVDLAKSAVIDDNGMSGDQRRELWQESDTEIVWIETNGNPEVYETIEEARAAL